MYKIGSKVALPVQYYENTNDFSVAPYGTLVDIDNMYAEYRDAYGVTRMLSRDDVPFYEEDNITSLKINFKDSAHEVLIKNIVKKLKSNDEEEVSGMMRKYVFESNIVGCGRIEKDYIMLKGICKYVEFSLNSKCSEKDICKVYEMRDRYIDILTCVREEKDKQEAEEEEIFFQEQRLNDIDKEINEDASNKNSQIKITKSKDKEINPEDYLINMTEQARKKNYDKAYKVEGIVQELVVSLLKRDKRNVILRGKQGCGKTSIVEQLANMIANDEIPKLKEKEILKMDITSMISGCTLRGMFEERVKVVMDYIVENKDKCIVFIDEIHRVMGVGNSKDESANMANLLKEDLTKNTSIIGATTNNEFVSLSRDAAFARRFSIKNVKELSKDEVRKVMSMEKEKYEEYHEIKTSDSLIEAIISAYDPKKANTSLIDFTKTMYDEACSYMANANLSEVDAYKKILSNMKDDMETGNEYAESTKLGFSTGDEQEEKLPLEIEEAIRILAEVENEIEDEKEKDEENILEDDNDNLYEDDETPIYKIEIDERES